MNKAPDLSIRRVFDAPRALVFQAFTDPVQLASWWGPRGHTVSPEGISFDVRSGGSQRWTEVSVNEPDLRVQIYIDLTTVVDRELLEGVIHVSGQLQHGLAPFQSRFRIEFHDEAAAKTRLEVFQWLPAHLTGPTAQGWNEAFEKLDAALLRRFSERIHIKE